MIEPIVNKNLDRFILTLQRELRVEKINDTKKASQSLKKKTINKSKYQVLGLEYVEMLNKGIGKGNTDKVMTQRAYALYKSGWVKRKLNISDDKQQKQIAFAVSKKIQKEGTEIFKDNSKGIKLTKNVKELAKNLARDLAKGAVFEITEQLQKFNLKRQNK